MIKDNSTQSVIQHLREHIARQGSGDRLPSVRSLMASYRVGPVTVQRAMAELVSEGLIEARPGRGTFIAQRGVRPASHEDLGWQSIALGPGRVSAEALDELVAPSPIGAIPLSAGYLPEELQALPQLVAAMSRAVRRPGVWNRMPIEGLDSLRGWFARQIGNGAGAHDIIICPGSQASIAAIFRTLAAPGSAVLVESPTYIGAMTAARAAGLRLVPVPTDARGVRTDLLAEAFVRSGARIFYGQPTYANPSGAVLAPGTPSLYPPRTC